MREIQGRPALHDKYAVAAPANLDGKRDQNSLILLDRRRFPDGAAPAADATARVLARVGGDWVAPGDLLAVAVADADGIGWLLASFHGDSGGLSTQPALRALDAAARAEFPRHVLLAGLDANTHSNVAAGPNPGLQQAPRPAARKRGGIGRAGAGELRAAMARTCD